jgi:aspartate-semialdehyde dehydrogenase
MASELTIALIGAGGLVGQVIIDCLQNSVKIKNSNIMFRFFTRETKLNSSYIINDKNVIIERFELSVLLNNFNYVLLATENDTSKEIIDYSNQHNLKTRFIDSSSQYRLDNSVPLVIPEVNPYDLQLNSNIISSPNCTTTFLVMLLAALTPLSSISRVIVSTYQSASGAGIKGLEELKQQTKDWSNDQPLKKDFWGKPLLFNVFSHNSTLQQNLYNSEEMKIINETRKILHKGNELKIVPTCIRVPVLTSHCESINIEFVNNLSKDEILKKLTNFPGISVMDKENDFPEPSKCSGKSDIYVGRIRPDLDMNANTDVTHFRYWNFFVCGDQLVKGSGLNSVQILEKLI